MKKHGGRRNHQQQQGQQEQQSQQTRNEMQQTKQQEKERTLTDSFLSLDKLMRYVVSGGFFFIGLISLFMGSGQASGILNASLVTFMVIVASGIEKQARIKGKPNPAANIVAWMLFGPPFFTLVFNNGVVGFILGILITIAAVYFRLNSNYLSLTIALGMGWNVLTAIMSPYTLIDKAILVYGGETLEWNDWKYCLTFFVIMVVGVLKNLGILNSEVRTPEEAEAYVKEKMATAKEKYNNNKKENKNEEESTSPQPVENAESNNKDMDDDEVEPLSKAFFQPQQRKLSLKEKILRYLNF